MFYSLVVTALKWPAASEMLSQIPSCLPIGTICFICFDYAVPTGFTVSTYYNSYPRNTDLGKCPL